MKPKHNIKDGIDMTDDGYQFDKDSPQNKPAAAETPAPKCPAWYDMNSCKECSGKICGGKGKPAAEKKKLCTCGQEDHEGHYCPPVEVRSRDDRVDMEKASEIQVGHSPYLGKNRWLCPDCGTIIHGPSYPKLHTCLPERVLSKQHRWMVQNLKDIIDRQAGIIAQRNRESAVYESHCEDYEKDIDRQAKQLEAKDAALHKLLIRMGGRNVNRVWHERLTEWINIAEQALKGDS